MTRTTDITKPTVLNGLSELGHQACSFSSLAVTQPRTYQTMARKPVIGLLGGGQLGRMLCEAAGPLGIDIAVLDEEKAPAKHAANLHGLHATGSFKDPARIRELASRSDVLTVEIEHVDTDVLEDIATNGVVPAGAAPGSAKRKIPVHPSWKTLRLIQDKFLQKEHFRERGLPIAEQMAIGSGDSMLASLKGAGQKFGYPFMLKVCRLLEPGEHCSGTKLFASFLGSQGFV